MARVLYGGSPADYFIDASGTPIPGQTADVYRARTGGTVETDLQDISTSDIDEVTADDVGGFRFYGPDGYRGALWIVPTGGTLRYLVNPTDLADQIATIVALGTLETEAGAQDKADAAQDAAVSYVDGALVNYVYTSTGVRLEKGTELVAPSSLPPGTIQFVTPI